MYGGELIVVRFSKDVICKYIVRLVEEGISNLDAGCR
jgi:hypothetical protein